MAVPKPRTDLGELYYEAELQYTTITGQPFGISLVQHIDDVKNVAQQAASQFDQKRHDGRLGDRLRTLVGNNIGTIQKVVNHFAGAATAGFPPCAPVFTAFNCVVGACVAVKADYDLLDTFFSDVGRQLNLIGVLEGNLNRINVQEPFASIKDVFIMVIRVCAFAVAYIKEKRLFHSAKSLVLGKDDKLAGAYSELGAACKRLSDIVGVATLAMTARIDTRVEDGFRNMTNTMNSLIEKTGGTLPKLKALFKDAPDFSAAQQIRKPLEGTTTWLFEDEIYKEWETKEKPILWLHGLPGTGKTYLACSILERLKLRSRRLRRSPCGWFFFSNTREDTRSMVNALVGAVLQIAQEDEVYARQVLASLENQERDWFHAPLSEVWDVFFKDRFTTQRSEQSEVEVALVFDGFENVLDDERREFLRLCAQIKEQGLAIRLLLVGASDLEQDLTALGEDTISTILIDNSKNRQDVELFVDDQMKGLTRQFERETLTTIASRLKEKGSFYYILLALKTVASSSQDEDALDSLDRLPEAIEEGYEALLERIGRGIRPKEIEAFKVLIRWVAFSKRDLSLNEARSLIQQKTQYSNYNPRMPIKGKLASILALSDVAESDNMGFMSERPILHRSHTSHHDFLEDEDEDEGEEPIQTSKDTVDEHHLSTETNENDNHPLADNAEATISMKEDIREWLRQSTRTSKLITKPMEANVDLCLTCLTVLSSTGQDPMFEKWKPLHDYATQFWLEHLRDVGPEDVSREQVTMIVEKIVDVFTVPDTAYNHFGKSPVKAYSEFGPSSNEGSPGKELIITWCRKAKTSGGSLRPRTREWIEAVIERPERILEQLAREHVAYFYRSAEEDMILTAFIAAFYSVITVVTDLPEDFSLEGSRFLLSDITLVTGAFPDIPMTAGAHYAVEYMLTLNDHYLEASQYSNKALTLSPSTHFTIKVMGRQALINHATKQHAAACENCENAFALSKTNEIEADEAQKKDLQAALAEMNKIYAAALFALNKYPEAIEAWERVLIDEFNTIVIDNLLECYNAAKDYQGFINRLKKLDADQRATWITNFGFEDERRFNYAAKITGDKDVLVQSYREAIEVVEKWPAVAELLEVQARFGLARAYWRVFEDEDAAYRELDRAYDILGSINISEDDGGRYSFSQVLKGDVNKLFSELIFSRIHASPVKWVKRLLLEDLERVAKPPKAAKGSDVELRGFMYATLVAKAYLDHGRKKDALEILNPIFTNSVAALQDDTGANDSMSFRLLARVLAYMSLASTSLDQHALIAYSAQFSQVNPNFDHKRVGPNERNEDSDDGSAKDKANGNGTLDLQNGKQAETPAKSEANETTPESSLELSYEEDLQAGSTEMTGARCDGCGAGIWRWNQSFYMCMVCANVDLCEACYAQQVARNNGQPFDLWYDYCGKNHTYLKGPLEGWAGVKDGIMSIGEEKIKFEHWLSDVERDWHDLGVELALKRRATTPLPHVTVSDGQ